MFTQITRFYFENSLTIKHWEVKNYSYEQLLLKTPRNDCEYKRKVSVSFSPKNVLIQMPLARVFSPVSRRENFSCKDRAVEKKIIEECR